MTSNNYDDCLSPSVVAAAQLFFPGAEPKAAYPDTPKKSEKKNTYCKVKH